VADVLSDFDLAVAAYQADCDRQGLTFQQPSEEYSKQVSNVVYLRTSNVGYLARYNVKRRRILV
jgi:hypothetical protein